MMQPITIAGGGLAGLSLGLALRKKDIPVELHEAGEYPRHRVCGEFISGVRDSTLAALGIGEFFSQACPQRTTAWYLRDKLVARPELPAEAKGISRYYLDQALRLRFQELGGVLHPNSRLTSDARPGLVWCAGRRPAKGEWIGLKCHVRDLDLAADLEMHVGREAYVGLATVEDGVTNLCGLFRLQKERSSEPVLRSYLRHAGLDSLAQRIWNAAPDEDSFSAVAGFRLGWQSVPEGLFVLGDSLAMIPPFTGNGMSMAFESAEIAVDPLYAYARGKIAWPQAWRHTRRALRRRFSRRLLLAQVLHPFLTSAGGQPLFSMVLRRGMLPFRLCFQLLR